MAITKPLHELTLDDINEELEAGGIDKKYSRIDHARNAVRRLVDENKLVYMGSGSFYDSDAMEKAEELNTESESNESETPNTVDEKKPKPEKKMVWLSKHEMALVHVYTRFGRHRIERVGHVEEHPDRLKAELSCTDGQGNPRMVSLKSCRQTAVRPEYRSRYPVDHGTKTKSGKPSIGVDDQITDALKGQGIEELKKVCAENKLDYQDWAHLNPGMQRMCVGNRLRGMARKGQRVVVLGEVITPGALEE